MTIWARREAAADLHGRWPKIGSNLTVGGKIAQYRGRPEIVINDTTQMAKAMSGILDTSTGPNLSDTDVTFDEEASADTGTFMNILQIDRLVEGAICAMLLMTAIFSLATVDREPLLNRTKRYESQHLPERS